MLNKYSYLPFFFCVQEWFSTGWTWDWKSLVQVSNLELEIQLNVDSIFRIYIKICITLPIMQINICIFFSVNRSDFRPDGPGTGGVLPVGDRVREQRPVLAAGVPAVPRHRDLPFWGLLRGRQERWHLRYFLEFQMSEKNFSLAGYRNIFENTFSAVLIKKLISFFLVRASMLSLIILIWNDINLINHTAQVFLHVGSLVWAAQPHLLTIFLSVRVRVL